MPKVLGCRISADFRFRFDFKPEPNRKTHAKRPITCVQRLLTLVLWHPTNDTRNALYDAHRRLKTHDLRNRLYVVGYRPHELCCRLRVIGCMNCVIGLSSNFKRHKSNDAGRSSLRQIPATQGKGTATLGLWRLTLGDLRTDNTWMRIQGQRTPRNQSTLGKLLTLQIVG